MRESHGESAAALQRRAGLPGIRLWNEDHCAARQCFSSNAEERRRSALTGSSIRRNCDSLTPPHLAPHGLTTRDDALTDVYLSCLLHSPAPLAISVACVLFATTKVQVVFFPITHRSSS